MKLSEIPKSITDLADRVEEALLPRFRQIDRVARENTARVLEAFGEYRVSDTYFAGTTGYGYDDQGRDALDKIYARVFGAESALVRIGFVNGTHAITAMLFAAVKPGQILLSVTGEPYDTLRSAIGIHDAAFGSLKFYGVDYRQIELLPDGGADLAAIRAAAADPRVGAVTIQRSRGYAQRRALSVKEIGEIVRTVKEVNPAVNVVVDNCYGEFTDVIEPCHVGADLMAGSWPLPAAMWPGGRTWWKTPPCA